MANAGLEISRWLRREDEVIRQLYPRGTKPEILKALPGRTWKGIVYRAAKLGVKCESRSNTGCILAPVIVRDGVAGKACLTCHEWKTLEKFQPKHAPGVGNTKPRCTRCESRNIRNKYPEVQKKASVKYRKNNPEKLYLASMRARALKAGVPVQSITSEEVRHLRVMYGDLCAYCRKRSGDTLDHVMPISKGGEHSLANLLPACFRCNHSKKDKTLAEWAASDVPHNPFRDSEE